MAAPHARGAQLGRRVAYGAAGVLPGAIDVVLATAHGTMIAVGAFTGVIGLLLATAAWRPAGRRAYAGICLLLAAGLAALCAAVLRAGGDTLPALADLPAASLAMGAWLLLGPAACAIHFIAAARRAPG